MRKLLVVIDMQKDFIDGALGTPEAERIVPRVLEKIASYAPGDVFATMDTHGEDYLNTQEGHLLPVTHCVRGTPGWELQPEIRERLRGATVIEKPTFGSIALGERLLAISREEEIEITFIGLCTDICVVSNALICRALMPEVTMYADVSCCAGVTPEKHRAAVETMRSCQIRILGEE